MSDVAAELLGQLRLVLGTELFEAGERLAASGCVRDVRVLQAGRVFTGIAASGVDEPRRVYVQYQAQRAAALTGECSCEERAPCVHVAAICIAAARQVSSPGARGSAAARALPSFNRPFDRRVPQCLCYCLEKSPTGSEWSVTLWVATPSTDPMLLQPRSATVFEPRTALIEGRFPRYVAAADAAILRALAPHESAARFNVAGASAMLVPRMVATGRAHWESLQTPPLRLGAARRLQFSWQWQHDGAQRLICAEPGQIELLLEAETALYVDVAAHVCGQLEPTSERASLREFWQRPVLPEEIAVVNQRLSASGLLPALQPIAVAACAANSVRGRLLLTSAPAHSLQFIYNELPVEPGQEQYSQVRVLCASARVVYEIERDRSAEQRLRTRLAQATASLCGNDQRAEWLAFMLHAVPTLQAEGWEVVVPEHFPYRIAHIQDWYTELAPQRGSGGWFDLRLGVRVDEQSCNLLPALVDYLQSGTVRSRSVGDAAAEHVQIGELLLLRLGDGRFVPVPMARIERIAQTLVELFDHDALNARQAVSLQRSQASRLLLLEAEPAQVRCEDAVLLRLLTELKATHLQPLAAPPGFHATLRPYQAEGLGWLQLLRRCGLGGILADDMGLGKTLQTLAHLLLDKQQRSSSMQRCKPSLIVAPTSVIGNWQRELRRFAPELELVVLHGSRRRELFASVARCDVALTGYPQLLLDEEFLLSCDFALLVLDEAQMIKNPRTRAAQVVRTLHAEQRLCLTGTPLENHLGELWALLDFAQPGLLGTEQQFQRWYRTPIEKESNAQRATALSRRIAPFLLRRTKDTVATDLPDKTQIVESLVLEERQRDLYDAIRLSMHQRVQEVIAEQGLARSQITILDALLKLRQACCDPRLVQMELGPDVAARASIPSAKLQWLVTVLPQLAAEGRRTLLFSQFTAMLSLIEAAVGELGIDYCLLTGSTRDRDAQVARFQSGAVPLFLISLKAGGTGLNLTAADTVIHYDPWWNPAVESQATDRAHRIGQRQPVFVYKLITQDTVEEKILKLQADKHALANALYSEQLPLTQLSATELAELLAP